MFFFDDSLLGQEEYIIFTVEEATNSHNDRILSKRSSDSMRELCKSIESKSHVCHVLGWSFGRIADKSDICSPRGKTKLEVSPRIDFLI